jgi:hypothetical protein
MKPSNVIDFAERLEAKRAEECWKYICEVCVRYAGISAQQAGDILNSVGRTVEGHRGIVDAINEVVWIASPELYDEVLIKLGLRKPKKPKG